MWFNLKINVYSTLKKKSKKHHISSPYDLCTIIQVFWSNLIALCEQPTDFTHYSLLIFPSSELLTWEPLWTDHWVEQLIILSWWAWSNLQIRLDDSWVNNYNIFISGYTAPLRFLPDLAFNQCLSYWFSYIKWYFE